MVVVVEKRCQPHESKFEAEFMVDICNKQERNEFISHFEKKQGKMIISSVMVIGLLETFSFKCFRDSLWKIYYYSAQWNDVWSV